MKVNISYLDTGYDLTDKKNMWRTYTHYDYSIGKEVVPAYTNTDISFSNLYKICSISNIQYSPYMFVNDGLRHNRNWNNDKQNLLIFDIDDGMSIDEAKYKFRKFTYLIVTTKSHQKNKKGKVCDRFRVILPATNIPKGELYFSMLDIMSKEIPMDTQVNSKDGAFIGYDECMYFYSYGKTYDCSYAIPRAEENMLNMIKIKYLEAIKKENRINGTATDIKSFKELVDDYLVFSILDSFGYKKRGRFYSLRDNDRTPSAKVYPNGFIVDYGDSFKGDILDFLHTYHSMKFNDAIMFVKKFMKG